MRATVKLAQRKLPDRQTLRSIIREEIARFAELNDPEVQAVRLHFTRFSEHYPPSETSDSIVAGFLANRRAKPGLSAKQFLGA